MPQDIKTKETRLKEEESPKHPRWKVIFSLYSWWLSIDNRTLVICQRWSDKDGNIEYLEILEVDNELLKLVPWALYLEEYRRGKLTRISKASDEQLPPIPFHLYPDRNY